VAEYWYNTETGEVEEGQRSDWSKVMGPYPSRESAQQALDKARARTQEWDREDEERR
jgi:hypothetical protein